MTYPRSRFLAWVLITATTAWTSAAHGIVLSDFNGTGFDYTFEGFAQTVGPTQVRLADPINGWGGAGTNFANPLDMRGVLNQYLQVDYTVQPGHGTGQLVVEFYDTADRSVKFSVPTPLSNAGVPRSFTSRSRFADPDDGIGDFANFDYANVVRYNVLGDFGSPSPFDVALDRVRFTPVAPEAYGGRSADAAWRTQAEQRIDQFRKADLEIALTRPDGTPIEGAAVSIVQQEHAFGFGSAVVGNRLVGNANATNAIYRQKVLDLFNTVTLENTLKWQALEGEFGGNFSESIALAALNWAQDNDLDARGHTIVWPGNNNLPQSAIALENDPAAQRQFVLDHVRDIAAKTQGLVKDWDVVNEPRVNRDLLDRFGDAVMDEWFAQADAVNDARLFLNEFDIITGNDANDANRTLYLEQIEGLQQRGAPIDAIGMQGHFRPNTLTDIEQVWAILDGFHDATGLPVAITEFDFETTDRQLQADYLRDFMTAVFAHEAVDEFVMWGFWENAHWRPDAALFDADWTIRPAGQAYLDLVYGQWWTDEALLSAADGSAESRVFQGDYQIEVTVDGVSRVYDVVVGPEGLLLSDVFAASLVGDYNGNGTVEQGDLDRVLNSWGAARGDWYNADGFATVAVDQEELDRVLNQWGSAVAPSFGGVVVPEPGAGAVLVGIVVGSSRRRRVASRRG